MHDFSLRRPHVELWIENSLLSLAHHHRIVKQDGKPIKWTCDEGMALGYMHIVAEHPYFLQKYPYTTYRVFYSVKWS